MFAQRPPRVMYCLIVLVCSRIVCVPMAGFPVGVYASVLCLLADLYNRPKNILIRALHKIYVIWQMTVEKDGGGAVTYPSLKFIYLYFHISESCWKLFSTISFISISKCVISNTNQATCWY